MIHRRPIAGNPPSTSSEPVTDPTRGVAMLERSSSNERARQRMRRQRARRRQGMATYKVEVPEFALVDALIAAERLSERDLSRAAVERAISQLLADWSKRWEK